MCDQEKVRCPECGIEIRKQSTIEGLCESCFDIKYDEVGGDLCGLPY